MASLQSKLRIAASVLFATGFWDAVMGRFLFEPRAASASAPSNPVDTGQWQEMVGALHVHSTYSDGGGDIPTVMQAACEAGVDFVLLTDHNTQRPRRDGWESRCSDRPYLLIGTEVTVEQGAFLLALDMPSEWEPTKGLPPQAAIDEVNQHGGIPLISLPFDVKHPWLDWDVTGCTGLEVANLSTVARRHINVPSLLWLLPVHFARGAVAAQRSLLTRPDAELARWDHLTRGSRPVVGIGALDAHALMKIGRRKYPVPSYADTLGIMTTHFLLPPGVTEPSDLRREIYAALRSGRCYIAYDCLGNPAPISFTACRDDVTTTMGGTIQGHGKPALFRACARPGTLLRLYHEGRVVAAATDRLEHFAAEPGAYRIEGYQYQGRIGPLYFGTRPWFFTNPIYLT